MCARALGVAALALAAMVAGAAAREPMPLAPVSASFAAPYDRVWDATLKGLGVVKLLVADKATGRIQTEPYSFSYLTTSAQDASMQVIQVALQIQVSQAAGNTVTIQVNPELHDSLFSGFTPGPTNNPWTDLFSKIADQLRAR
jgi:hypothetical protein